MRDVNWVISRDFGRCAVRWWTPSRCGSLRGGRRSGYLDMIRSVGWISVSVDTLHLGTLHHFFVGAGDPDFGVLEPAVTGGIDGKFARRQFVAEHAAALSKMNLPETDHLLASRHQRQTL